MDDTASKIHENRMAVAAGFGLVALLLFWLAVGWGFLGSLLAGIVVFALILLLIGWIGPGEAATTTKSAAKPLAATAPVTRRSATTPSNVAGGSAAPGGTAGASAAVPSGPAPGAGTGTAEPAPIARPNAAPVAVKPIPEPGPETTEPTPVAEKPDTKPEPAVAPASPAVPVATVASETAATEGAGAKPATLEAPRDGDADDLKRIKGVGPKLEALCNRLGFWHFDQIAAWTDDEVAWVDEHLEGFRGRVQRDGWVAQARELTGGGSTAFSERVDQGVVY